MDSLFCWLTNLYVFQSVCLPFCLSMSAARSFMSQMPWKIWKLSRKLSIINRLNEGSDWYSTKKEKEEEKEIKARKGEGFWIYSKQGRNRLKHETIGCTYIYIHRKERKKALYRRREKRQRKKEGNRDETKSKSIIGVHSTYIYTALVSFFCVIGLFR